MKSRCLKPTNPSYRHYGERGIGICSEWMGFEAFYSWAKANGYHADLSIDRIDNDKGYAPDNCRWADRTTQSRNRRFCRHTSDGRMAIDVADENGIPRGTLRVRLNMGWDIDRAATQPYKTRRVERERCPVGRYTA